MVPSKVKDINAKVFNLISGLNETRYLVQHELYECKCRLNESVFNSKKKWNYDECRCECKELDDWDSWEKGYMWDPRKCHCECNKACKIDEYVDNKNCSCEKRLVGKLVLAYEDEILNITETSLDDKKGTWEKSNCLNQTISLINICLLLAIVISCFYFYTRDWIKKESVVSY